MCRLRNPSASIAHSRAADDKHGEAQLGSKDAEIDVLRAQLAERDAEIDLLLLQWGHSNQHFDSAVETARAAVSTAKSLGEIARSREIV